jgi:uncharacterized damage-inducible protein DinB
MAGTISHVITQYQINNYLFNKAFEDIDASHHHVRPDDRANSLHFIAGHVTAARYGLARMVGIEENVSWGQMFDRGITPRDRSEYPPLDDILSAWNAITPKLVERLKGMTEEELKADGPEGYPGDDKSVGNVIAFLSLHESYHMGQLSYARKLLGYDGLVG